MTDPTPPLNLALTLALIGFLLAFVGLLWLRREERIRQETIEAAANKHLSASEMIEAQRREFEEWLGIGPSRDIWTARQRDTLYGLPSLQTRLLHDLDDDQGTDVIGDRPGPMIY